MENTTKKIGRSEKAIANRINKTIAIYERRIGTCQDNIKKIEERYAALTEKAKAKYEAEIDELTQVIDMWKESLSKRLEEEGTINFTDND